MAKFSGLPIYSDAIKTLEEWAPRLIKALGFALKHSTYELSNETETGELWLKGQKIFRQVIDVAPLPNTTTKTYTLDLQYKRILKIYGYGYEPNTGRTIPICMPFATGINSVQAYVTGQTLSVEAGANLSNYTDAYIVLEYIKET